jgi:hypothetical protein
MAEAEGYLGPNADKMHQIEKDVKRFYQQGFSKEGAIEMAAALNEVELTPEEWNRLGRYI